jgi:hypothetical protein
VAYYAFAKLSDHRIRGDDAMRVGWFALDDR